MNLDEFNERLIVKHNKITENEIKEAIANICLTKRNFSYGANNECKKAIEGICHLINDTKMLTHLIYFYFEDLVEWFVEDYCDNFSVAQLVAINDYCYNQGYESVESLLKDLKESGVIDERSPLEDLAEQVADDTYETMYNYLMEC
jgi:hypothetical protein